MYEHLLYRRNARSFLPHEISPGILARCYGINPRSDFVMSSFEDYIKAVGFTHGAVLNYDFYDLFYWEHRSGAWQGLQIADFDMAHETLVLYNNKRVLEMRLGVPLEDRLNDTLQKRLLRLMLPECAHVPLLSQMKPWYIKATREVDRIVKYFVEGRLESLNSLRRD